MKLNQVITGCALAAGLMAIATPSQAGVVIGNTLYAPAKIKAKITEVVTKNDKDSFKSFSLNDKDLLQAWELADKGNQIATMVDTGEDAGIGGIYVINSKGNSVVTDLIYDGLAEASASDYLYTEDEKSNSYKYSEQGYADIYFYTAPWWTDGSGVNMYGNYKASYQENYNNNNPSFKASASFDLKNVPTEAFDFDNFGEGYDSYNFEPGTGSISAKGNGKLIYGS